MPGPIPIYRDHDESYRADSCRPLTEAAAAGRLCLKALRHGHYPGKALPTGELPGIKMVGYWNTDEDQDWGLDWHRNEGIEITFLASGHLQFGAEGHQHQLRPDDMTIARPWQQHRVGAPNVSASRLIWVILDVGVRRPNQPWRWPQWVILGPKDLAQLTEILRHNEQPVWQTTADVRRCFQAIARAVDEAGDTGSVSRLTLRLNEVLMLILDLLRNRRVPLDQSLSSTRRTVELFLDDLMRHPKHLALRWTLEDMADSCGLGPTRFVEHVRALSNMSPVQFLNHCRLEHAARLLRENPTTSITEAALSCGFGSSQYFATAFAARFGCSPRDYRSGTWRANAAGRGSG